MTSQTSKADLEIFRSTIFFGSLPELVFAKIVEHSRVVPFVLTSDNRRKPFPLATVAMANKSARIIWTLLTKQEEFGQQIARSCQKKQDA
jgi:transposase